MIHELRIYRLKRGKKKAFTREFKKAKREFNQSTQHLRQRNTFIEAFCG